MLKNRLKLFLIYLLVLFFIPGVSAEIIPDIQEINNLRNLKRLHVSIKQFYSDFEAKKVLLPFEYVTGKMFGYAGINLINSDKNDNDIVLKIKATGRKHAVSYDSGENYDTLIYLTGTISLEIHENPVVQKRFDVYIESTDVRDNDHDLPVISPYNEAFYMQDSFISKLTELIYDVYGINPLIFALNDEDTNIQKRVEETIIKIGEPAVKPLITALKYNDLNIRKEAVKILGAIKDIRSVEYIVGALKDEHVSVRWWAAKVLGEVKDIIAVESLIDALKDENASVRWRAAKSLGEIKDNRAVESLMELLKDENSGVRCIAAEALKNITGKDYVAVNLQKNQVYEKESRKKLEFNNIYSDAF